MQTPKTYSLFKLSLLVIILSGCTRMPTDVTQKDELPDIYPDYVGVTIPVGIAPFDFSMADDDVETIDVEVKGSNGGFIHANGSYADFDIDEWHKIVEENKGGTLTLTVCAEKDGRWTRYRDFPIMVSNEDLDAWGITYRRIPPSYEIYSKMGLYQRNLSNFDESALLENTEMPGQCIREGATAPSPPTRRRRCSILPTTSASRSTTTNRMSSSTTHRQTTSSRTR